MRGTRSKTRRLSAWILALSIGVPVSAGATEDGAGRVDALMRELLLLVQGEPIPVRASPEICPGSDQGLLEADPEEWYFGREACRLVFPPSLTAIVTSASEWDSGHLFESPRDQTALVGVLAGLAEAVAAEPLHGQQRLMVHTTIWELVFGLKRSGERSGLSSSLQEAVCLGLDLLASTAYPVEEAAEVPDTLPSLPGLADAPEIRSMIDRLRRQDPRIVEVSTTDLHADVLFGRFAARIFLTARDETQGAALAEDLRGETLRYTDLRNLPLRFEGLNAILVLYFNVLTPDLKILPTEQVAFWQEYWFTDLAGFELPLAEKAQRIRFRTIAYQRELPSRGGPGGGPPKYRELDQRGMARRGFLDVKPLAPEERVSSLRAHCLRCHMNQIATFDTHGLRNVGFLKPFSLRGRDLLTTFFLESFEPKLQAWVRSCRAGSESAESEALSSMSTPREMP